MRVMLVPAGLLMLLTPRLATQATPRPAAVAAPLRWGPAPAVFPPGARMAVVSGDPFKEGPFTVRLSTPNGYRIPPHFHPTDEAVEVSRGTLLFGMGDTLVVAKTQAMKVGAKGSVAANMHHFVIAKGLTVVIVTSMGPFAMTYVNQP